LRFYCAHFSKQLDPRLPESRTTIPQEPHSDLPDRTVPSERDLGIPNCLAPPTALLLGFFAGLELRRRHVLVHFLKSILALGADQQMLFEGGCTGRLRKRLRGVLFEIVVANVVHGKPG